MSQVRRWSLLSVVVALAILGAGWFLLVAPKHSEASDLRDQTATAEKSNTQLRMKLAQLKALAPELPKREAEFAAIRKQIPDNPALPDLIRQLTAAADKSDATVVSLAPATPIPLVQTGQPTAAGATASTEQLLQVPLAIEMRGSYSELEDFVGRLEKLRRVVLVSGFALEQTQGDAALTDQLRLTLTSRVYMVNPAPVTAPAPVAAGAGTTSSTPGDASGSGTATPAATAPAAN
jgi:Tfp pilus assembly protein PilO